MRLWHCEKFYFYALAALVVEKSHNVLFLLLDINAIASFDPGWGFENSVILRHISERDQVRGLIFITLQIFQFLYNSIHFNFILVFVLSSYTKKSLKMPMGNRKQKDIQHNGQ